jgi:hypothetical protein
MTRTLNKVLIAAALFSLMVIACDKPQRTRIVGEQAIESAEHGNTRCVLVDGQVFCASSRMREPIQSPSIATL